MKKLINIVINKKMTYKEMIQAISSAKAGYIFTQREKGISFEKIGQSFSPKITKQAAFIILDNFFKRIDREKTNKKK